MDKEYGAGLKKVLIRHICQTKERKEINLAVACRVFGISRQSVYWAVSRMEYPITELSAIKEWVFYWRKLGARKLYKLIKKKLIEDEIKLGRDDFFTYLKSNGLLVKPKKIFMKTTFSNTGRKASKFT